MHRPSRGHLIADWVQNNKVAFEELEVRFIAEDWRTVESLIEKGIGFGIIPSYIQSHSPFVERIELPESVLKPLSFYAMFETSLKKIEAFRKLLTFSKFKGLS